MEYAPPIGHEAQGEDAIYIDGNPEAGIEGSAVPAKAMEPGMRELIHLIRFAGLTPSGTDLEQVRKAIGILIESAAPGLATLLQPGLVMPDGVTLKIDAAGKLSVVAASKYEVGEFYLFRHPTLKPGMQPANGGLIANAVNLYPQIWAYLQTADGQLLCKSEAQWQAMAVSFGGIGGVPFYVQDLSAGTLRMFDMRGMCPEASGFDSLGVGDVHLDQLQGHSHQVRLSSATGSGLNSVSSTAAGSNRRPDLGTYSASSMQAFTMIADAVNGSPRIGSVTKTRGWGGLGCCFMGTPAS